MIRGMGFRTIKTAIGAGLAVWLASLLDLEFATFAGIIVIMCIEKTKKKTLRTMKEKFFASLLSLLISALFFELMSYHPVVFSLFILLFVPLLVRLRIQGGFVTSMVVALHIYTLSAFNIEIFLNELYIIAIGMGIAILVNSIMPDLKKNIASYKEKIEKTFSTILYEFSVHLVDQKREWDGKELLEVEETIEQAKSLVIQDVENHLLRKLNKDYYYLDMREDQLDVLNQMMRIVAEIFTSDVQVEQRQMIADILEHLSKHVDDRDTTDDSLNRLETCMVSIREAKLPKTRGEFEVRANLFYLVFEIENYLNIKKKLFAKI